MNSTEASRSISAYKFLSCARYFSKYLLLNSNRCRLRVLFRQRKTGERQKEYERKNEIYIHRFFCCCTAAEHDADLIDEVPNLECLYFPTLLNAPATVNPSLQKKTCPKLFRARLVIVAGNEEDFMLTYPRNVSIKSSSNFKIKAAC